MTRLSGSMTIRQGVPLAPYTTLGVGGPARWMAHAASEQDLLEALAFASTRNLPVVVLGGGSNILVSDQGFPGLVIRVELRGVLGEDGAGGGLVSAAAGEDWDQFVAWAVRRNLAGIECLSGIPGTVGGTPVQNVGAYGQEVSDVIRSVRVVDRSTLAFVELDRSRCGFAYRSSIFNSGERDRYVVTSVRFLLSPGGAPTIRYPDLERRFSDCIVPPGLLEVRDSVLDIRNRKGMIIREDDSNSRSAGSFFKNPVVTPEAADNAEQAARRQERLAPSDRMPRYQAPDGKVKIPAAWLIEKSGYFKGYRRGRAGISEKHTLALVNLGGASAGEIVELAREIQSGVESAFGLELLPEPVFIGFQRETS